MSGASWKDCQAVVERVLEGLDWRLLGRIYCNSDGEEFWRARRPAVVDLGTVWAQSLLRRLPACGRSLYVGAGVMELPVMIAEILLGDRKVEAANLRARECDTLNQGLRAAGWGDRLQIVCADAASVGEAEAFDHLAVVGVLSDPETFPLCSGVGYGRTSPVQLDVEAFATERETGRELVARLWTRLQVPGWITTTAEEVAWFLEQAAGAGADVEADDELVATAVVGDPVGFLRVTGTPAV